MIAPRIASRIFGTAARRAPVAQKAPASPVRTPLVPVQTKPQADVRGPLPSRADNITISQAARTVAQSPASDRLCSCPELAARPDSHPLQEIKHISATLSDIQALLFAQSGQADGNHDTGPVKADFLDLRLSRDDSSGVLNLVRKLVQLPLGSEITMQGVMGNQPFEIKVEIEDDKTEIKIEGLTFTSQQAMQNLLTDLRKQGVTEATIKGSTNGQKVEAEFQVQEGKGELKLEGFPSSTQDDVGTWLEALQSLGFQEFSLKNHLGDQIMALRAHAPATGKEES